MSGPAEPGPLSRSYPLGEPQPFTVAHRGLQYKGEIILSDQWRAQWGLPLEQDVYFRIVVLRYRRRVPTSEIQDSRTAVCIPSKGPSRAGGELAKELGTIRETQALYVTRRDQGGFVRSYLEEQRERLESQLLSEEAARYAGGRIESPTVFDQDIDWFFAGSHPDLWFQRLAGALLSWVYPSLPVEPSLLPRPLASEDVPGIYDAIFVSGGMDRTPLGEFGPGLGLSRREEPLVLDPGDCALFQQVRTELEGSQGELGWDYIQQLLAHASGLTRPLATLYLLSFVYRGRPETELRLASDGQLMFRDGRQVRGTRLTAEFIPLLPWREDLYTGKIVSIGLPGPEVSWNDALQYTSLLCQGLTEIEEGSTDASAQEQALLESLGELAKDCDRARRDFQTLAATVPSPNQGEPNSSLERISQVCEARDFQGVYELTRAAYGSPQTLLQDLQLLRQLLHLGESLKAIVSMKAYLDEAEIAAGYTELSFDRASLLEEMSTSFLLSGPQAWPVLRARMVQYQRRYGRAYTEHHDYYHQETSRLRASLEDAQRRLHALTLLNSIAELGEPLGTELVQRFLSIEQSIVVCITASKDIDLDVSPKCPECRLGLGEGPPSRELESFQRDLERALGEQNRRLSRMLVERILHQKVDQRLEDFLKILQASDLSALSDILNYELVVFVRELLRTP